MRSTAKEGGKEAGGGMRKEDWKRRRALLFELFCTRFLTSTLASGLFRQESQGSNFSNSLIFSS